MKSLYKVHLLIGILLLLTVGINAQDDTNKSDELPSGVVEVIKPYEPVLADARKIYLSPDLPIEDKTQPPVYNDYYIPTKFLNLQYFPPKIKPIAKKEEFKKDLDQFWLRLGFGNKLTPLADLQWSKKNDGKNNMGIQVGHISSREKESLRDFSNSGGKAFISHFGEQSVMNVETEFRHTLYKFYGTELDSSFGDLDTISNRSKKSNDLNIAFGIHSKDQSKKGFVYNTNFNPYYYWIKEYQNELGTNLNLQGIYKLESGIYFGLNSDLNYQALDEPIGKQKDLMVQLIPHIGLRKNIGNFSLGLDMISIKDESMHLFPDLLIELPILNKKLNFYAAWNKRGIDNSLKTINNENPFFGASTNNELGANTFLLINDHIDENRKAGLLFNLGGKLQGDLSFHQTISSNRPFFVPDLADSSRFALRYEEKFNDIKPSIALNYAINQESKIGINFNYHIMDTNSLLAPYYQPKMEAGLTFRTHLLEKLKLEAGFNLLTGMKGLNADHSEIINLKTIPEMNIEINYRVIPALSLFCRANNIISKQYNRYLNYPVYGVRVIGGLLLNF